MAQIVQTPCFSFNEIYDGVSVVHEDVLHQALGLKANFIEREVRRGVAQNVENVCSFDLG